MMKVEIPISTTADTSGAQQQAQAIKNLKDETERYNAALKKMAEEQEKQQFVQETGKRLAGEAAQRRGDEIQATQRSSDRQAMLAERKQLVAAADKDIEAGIKRVTQADIAAATASTEANTKTTSAKRMAKDAVRGLAMEFPLLGRFAAMALNPITIAVAAVTGAFSIWKARVDALAYSLGGVELPDIPDSAIANMDKATSALKTFNDELVKAIENYRSAGEESKRFWDSQDKEFGRKEKKIDSDKNLQLAALEARKNSMPAGEYELRKEAIISGAERASQANAEARRRAELAEQGRKAGNLLVSSQGKLTEASGIRVGSAENEAEEMAKSTRLAEAAQKDLAARKERLGFLVDYASGEQGYFKDRASSLKFHWRYNAFATSMDEAMKLEQDAIASDEAIIAQHKRFSGGSKGRADARGRRETLSGEAGREAGEGWGILQNLPGASASLEQDLGLEGSLSRNEGMGRALEASQRLNQQAEQIANGIAKSLQSGQGIQMAVLDRLAEIERVQRQIQSRLNQGVRGAL
jgi:hypothetical protein